ncbi:hypothetical protein [Spiractinospora alimapuensis]|uniref:hypothetical protein n=1 Tax=Spiractinospora alimapuensis TaxID=2820884 RepID=UPI001F31D88F|nr:hypothetical protein [Spiractinospora alimapuensis]
MRILRRNETEEIPISADHSVGDFPIPSWAREVVLLGCHGGAGTTTLKTMLDTPWDLGAFAPERSDIGTYGRPLVLATRNTASASARATEAVTSLTTNGVAVAVLVVVADGAGHEPAEASTRFRMLEERVGGLVRFPFVSGLRYVDIDDTLSVALPRKAQRALVEIKKHAEKSVVSALGLTTTQE